MFKTIPLTQGKLALVDTGNWGELMKYRWCAHKIGNKFYAARRYVTDGGAVGIIHMHKQILGLAEYVDHIDGNGLNNCLNNLRAATNQQNSRNARKCIKPRYSRYKGVSIDRRNTARIWRAYIWNGSRQVPLGYFDLEKEAALAYDKAAKKYFGEFARLNFPELEEPRG